MSINIGSSSINSIYVGDTAVKSVYLGDKLVYSKQSEPVIEIDDSYNYYVFDTSKVSGSTTVTLQNNRGGDTTEWNGLNYWGDGTADTNLSHTYAKSGTYTVKTKYTVNRKSALGDDNTRNMFVECININRNITNYSYLFSKCKSLKSIGKCDTANVTSMEYTFAWTNFESLDLSDWIAPKVTSTRSMFYNCPLLTTLNLSSFITQTANTNTMFKYCSSLSYLDISNFCMDNTTANYMSMFTDCKKLTIDNIIMTNCSPYTKGKIKFLIQQ